MAESAHDHLTLARFGESQGLISRSWGHDTRRTQPIAMTSPATADRSLERARHSFHYVNIAGCVEPNLHLVES